MSPEARRRRRKAHKARSKLLRIESDNPQMILKDLEALMERQTNVSVDDESGDTMDLTPTLARCRRVILKLWERKNSNAELLNVRS